MAKTQMNSVSMHLSTQVSLLKMNGCIERSVEVMTSMNEF